MYSLILVRTEYIQSTTMPYDGRCTYWVILANVSTSLYIQVHTEQCQKSKVHTAYVQNPFCTYIVCTLYGQRSYSVRTVYVQSMFKNEFVHTSFIIFRTV